MKPYRPSHTPYHKPTQTCSGGSFGLGLLLLLWLFGGGSGSSPAKHGQPRPYAQPRRRKLPRKSRLNRCLPPGANEYGELR